MDRPFTEVLKSREPKFPFCLAWANQSWSGIWHGAPDRLLIEQTYPGEADYTNHFYSLLEAFQDERYLTVDDKRVFIIWKPHELPDPKSFTDLWRELAVRNGLNGLYFIGIIGIGEPDWNPHLHGFDAAVTKVSASGHEDQGKLAQRIKGGINEGLRGKTGATAIYRRASSIKQRAKAAMHGRLQVPRILDYAEFVSRAFPRC